MSTVSLWKSMKNIRWIKGTKNSKLRAMIITKETTAAKIAAYLHHEITLADLVAWAEDAVMEGEFSPDEMNTLRAVTARLGVADVRAFGLAWEDCEQLLEQLGYAAHVDVVAA